MRYQRLLTAACADPWAIHPEKGRVIAEFLGVRDYIRKPFAMEKLVRSIDKILGVVARSDDVDD